MALSRLINDQTIEIDNHNRGTEYKWDEAIHIHKRMNSKKYRGIEVLVPLAYNSKLDFRGVNGNKEIELMNEIEKAFSNPTIRTNFVRTLINSLSNLFNKSRISKDEWYGLFEEVAGRIAGYFGLNTKIKEKMGNDVIKISREKGLDIYLKANKETKSISISDNLEYINIK